MENNKGLYQLFSFFQFIVYLSIAVEILLYLFYDYYILEPLYPVIRKFYNLAIYKHDNIVYSKLFTLLLLIICTIGSKPRKNLDVKINKQIILPVILGLALFFSSLFFYFRETNHIRNNLSINEIFYCIGSILGIILLHLGMDNISKIIHFKLGDDKFNDENESFQQSEKKITNPYSVNIPMEYYHKKSYRNGWFNITNLFRGTIVTGVPESGKSFSIIIPFIKQTIAKDFTQLIYDYKYPDLSKVAYYHFLRNKSMREKGYKFHVVNLSRIEYSRRVNPLASRYMTSLAHCLETAEALVYSLQRKSSGKSEGSTQFFSLSAINFLAATLYFFSKYEGGKYSSLPHILFFLNKEYDEIFDVLTTNPELDSLLGPFMSAYRKKVYEQLEGQLGTLRINLGKLNTKESAWVFSGDEVDLRVSHKESPSVFIIGNDRDTQSTNASINSLLLNRLVKLINSPGNIPITISVDELPTIFFYQIQQLIATARSNKVAVLLGLQELPQLVESYGREIADSITSVIGNTISGAARNQHTLQWLEKLFGKSKQLKKGVSINRRDVSTSINENLDLLVPSSKIADLSTGEVVAKLASGNQENKTPNQNLNTYKCKIKIDLNELKEEENNYHELPKYFNFKSEAHLEEILKENYNNIKLEVDYIVSKF